MSELNGDILQMIYTYSEPLSFCNLAMTNYYYTGIFNLIADCKIPFLYKGKMRKSLILDKKKRIAFSSLKEAAKYDFGFYLLIKNSHWPRNNFFAEDYYSLVNGHVLEEYKLPPKYFFKAARHCDISQINYIIPIDNGIFPFVSMLKSSGRDSQDIEEICGHIRYGSKPFKGDWKTKRGPAQRGRRK